MTRKIKLNFSVSNILSYGMMIILAFVFLYPIVRMVWFSLSSGYGPSLSLVNYVELVRQVPFSRYFVNSIVIAGVTILAGLIVNSLLGYALARMRWRWASAIVGLMVALMIIPFEVLAVPLLLLTNSLGWLDSLHVQIIPFIADPFSVFLFYQFLLKFPRDLEDAAMVDGLGRFRTFWQIVVPNSLPVFAAAAILKFLFLWDSYLWPTMVTRGPEFRPLTVGIYGISDLSASAYGTLMTIPTIILFLLLQKWLLKGTFGGGLHG